MNPIAVAAGHRLPEGSRPVVFAKDQPQYRQLPAMVTPAGHVVTNWRPTTEELARLNAGDPITLVAWTFNQPLQPLLLQVGAVDLLED
jgi:hypothetical protein